MKIATYLVSRGYDREKDSRCGVQGAALIEFALILPFLLLLTVVAVDFGRLFHARLILTNLCREGGNLAARQFPEENLSDENLLSLLRNSGTPLDLHEQGMIYISRVRAGAGPLESQREPEIYSVKESGELNVSRSIHEDNINFGLTPEIYQYLRFDEEIETSIISEVVVVEVYYLFRPLTPLPSYLVDTFLSDDGGMIIGSRSTLQFFSG